MFLFMQHCLHRMGCCGMRNDLFHGRATTKQEYMVKLTDNLKKKGFFARLKQTVSRSGKDSEISYQEDDYPLITSEMLTPADKSVGTKNALGIYKKHMLAIGYLEKDEIGDFVDRFREEINEHELYLKEELKAAKEALAEARAEARQESKKLRKLRSKSKDEDEKSDFTQDLGEVEAEVRSAQGELAAASGALTRFKKDKRDFLINYINTEVHGSEWNNSRGHQQDAIADTRASKLSR